ncbi:hypothetical protein PPTG_23253 [Phytophthora nicotianae INRA-310]|uniref:Uncharacterized protein n=1 Tax=Phytophthora nicotianae (strain INRA-310) TaxID=761204 RepID=W2Q2E3_PHYN3|nr:hypothetical protein PPTG_23253 [Phytophthora nicotianae INRA-310]ETN07333.1 hypothetical protein PPTG_23253 [Phytophthora nicotianae INRA-310]
MWAKVMAWWFLAPRGGMLERYKRENFFLSESAERLCLANCALCSCAMTSQPSRQRLRTSCNIPMDSASVKPSPRRCTCAPSRRFTSVSMTSCGEKRAAIILNLGGAFENEWVDQNFALNLVVSFRYV